MGSSQIGVEKEWDSKPKTVSSPRTRRSAHVPNLPIIDNFRKSLVSSGFPESIANNIELLSLIVLNSKPSIKQKMLLLDSSDNIIRCFCELAVNLLQNTLSLGVRQHNMLLKFHGNFLRVLAKTNRGLSYKRNLLKSNIKHLPHVFGVVLSSICKHDL